MAKIKKAGFIKTSLAALAIALSGNCSNFNPVSAPQNNQRIEVSKRKLTSNASEDIKIKVESKINSFATKPIGALENGYYWVKSKEEKTPDFNNDRRVGFEDFFLFADNFNSRNGKYDLDSDGKVEFNDFFIFADAFGKEVNSDLSATKPASLKIPQVESFIEPRKIDLSDYVKDLVFNDPITYSIVSTNGLAAKLVKNDKGELSVIEYRPRGTFNKTDNGLAELVYRADKDGAFAEEKLEVEVGRDSEAMRHYAQLTRDAPDKWEKPFDVLVYTGPAKQSGDGIHPRTWTGPKITEQRKQYAIKAASETAHKLTSGFFKKNPNITLTDNPNELWDSLKGLDFYWDNSLPGGGGATNYDRDSQGTIYGASIRLTTEATIISPEWVYSHEIANAIGLSDARDEDNWSISSRRSTKSEPDPRDIFVGTAYYDAVR